MIRKPFTSCLGVALFAAVAHAAAPIETKHLTVAVGSPATPVPAGARVSLTLDVTPRRTMHVYAPGEKEFIPISLTIAADPAIRTSAIQFPKPERMMNALDEPQLVYSKPFRIVQDVTVALAPAAHDRPRPPATIAVRGTLRYQACDDTICYVPVNVPVVWTIAVQQSAR
jgi:DsbC/DsbD-like thiol-disulfide interchange protein